MLTGQPPVGTKACLPRLSPELVTRPRLESLLADELRRPVTLVCGPPGAGKTTLLATALDPSTGSVAWLCLDERDNDVRRLATLLGSALAPAAADEPSGAGAARVVARAPGVGAPAPASASAPGGSGAAGVATPLDAVDDLLGHVRDRRAPLVLVLDDVHELRAPAALDLLRRLIHQAPEQLHVVLASRVDPAVGLESLRLDGRLREIRGADLAFDADETAELLTLHDVTLDTADLRALWAHTEGWAAGLRLAACALQTDPDPGRFVRSATRTEAVVSDYLLRELLVHKDDAVQWFLLRTSVAKRLTVELAELLSDDPQAGEHLADLERCGVLVAERGDEGWYRYHSLFGALLRTRLRRTDPDQAQELHGRAARWFLEHDLPTDAEHHAQAAEEWSLLGQLVAWRWVDAVLDGYVGDYDLLPADLPDAVVAATPGLALVAAAEASTRGDREAAEMYRSALDGLADDDDYEALGVERRILDVTLGCAFGGDDRASQAASILQHPSLADLSATSRRRFGLLRRAELALDRGDFDAAARTLADLADRSDGGWCGTEAAAFLALVHATNGHPVLADYELDSVPHRGGWTTAPAVCASELAAVVSHALRGSHRVAAERVPQATAPRGGSISHALLMVERAARACLAGLPGRAVALDTATASHPFARHALVALGAVEVVTSEGRLVPVGGFGEQAIASARGRLAVDDVAGADEPIRRWMASASAEEARAAHPRTLLEAHVVCAVAAAARHDDDTAQHRLADALDLADAGGIVAPLLQYGTLLGPLLQRNLSGLGDRMGDALALIDRSRPTGVGDLVEQLTDREMEVLAHLPTLMSNAEIASGLHLSVNTVKTHLKAVYRKLGVDGRRQAVVRGRELELI
jgi:LuxR family transcriptional regulator, maltose regulon positive regulatory protein